MDPDRVFAPQTHTPSDCQVTHDGMHFTINGDPWFRYHLAAESVGSTGEIAIAASVSGGTKWQLEDRSGSCPMRVTLVEPRVRDETIEGSYKGMFCGYDVEIDATEFVPPDL